MVDLFGKLKICENGFSLPILSIVKPRGSLRIVDCWRTSILSSDWESKNSPGTGGNPIDRLNSIDTDIFSRLHFCE
jgi:hypothetical protein